MAEWKVQLAYKFEPKRLQDGEWFSLSEKLNGVRGTYFKGKIYSRQGREILGLDHILKDIQNLNLNDTVLDGELIRNNVDNLSDNENFRIGAGIIGSDASAKTEIKFVIFDMIPNSEFENGKSMKKYGERLEDLKKLKLGGSLEIAPILYSGTEQSKINELLEKVTNYGKEGLILNRDTVYQTKRNHGILKIKKFHTMDLKVKALEEGSGKYKNALGAFVVSYKDSELRVGTGLTDEQRHTFWRLGNKLKDRIIEVKYRTESQDKKTQN
jgi:DNA ligase-1